MRLPGLVVVAGVGAVAAAAAAQPEPAVDHATVRLWAPKPNLEPGQPEMLVLDFKIDENWHLYWNGLNDSGFPPEIEWKLPEGFELTGPVLWPAPLRHVSPGPLVDHIYENRVMLMVPVRAPKEATGRVHIEADLKWLVCKDVCLPGDGHVAIDLALGPNSDRIAVDRDIEAYQRFLARVPATPPKDAGVKVALNREVCDIHVPNATKITFYPLAKCTPPADLVNEGAVKGDALHMTLKPKKGKETRVTGVLEVQFGTDSPPKFWTIDTAAAETK